MRLRRFCVLAGAVAPLIGLVSCSSEQKGPQPPKPGTPAFFWNSAQASYKQGDFAKVVDQLGNITSSDNEYRNRARVWLMTVSAGIARGDMEWADLMDQGVKVARTAQVEFKKEAAQSRAAANQNAMRFVEQAHQYMETVKESEIPFGFGWPAVDPTKPPELERAAKGIKLNAAEIDKARTLLQQRGVLLAMAKMSGAGDDLKKAADTLANPDLTLPRDKFLVALAGNLVAVSDLYMPKKLDQAGRARLFCQEAQKVLAQAPPSKETKDLNTKIDGILKKLPKPVS